MIISRDLMSLPITEAEYLLVQHEQGPILSSPYRYKASEVNVPDNIQNIFNYYKQVIDTPALRADGDERVEPMDTWISRIMNFEYGEALREPYVYRVNDVDEQSPNAYVIAREYENAIVMKNFGILFVKIQ